MVLAVLIIIQNIVLVIQNVVNGSKSDDMKRHKNGAKGREYKKRIKEKE